MPPTLPEQPIQATVSQPNSPPNTSTTPLEPENDPAYDHYLDLIDFGRQVAAEVAVCAGISADWMR